jgi:hypothetical protein
MRTRRYVQRAAKVRAKSAAMPCQYFEEDRRERHEKGRNGSSGAPLHIKPLRSASGSHSASGRNIWICRCFYAPHKLGGGVTRVTTGCRFVESGCCTGAAGPGQGTLGQSAAWRRRCHQAAEEPAFPLMRVVNATVPTAPATTSDVGGRIGPGSCHCSSDATNDRITP